MIRILTCVVWLLGGSLGVAEAAATAGSPEDAIRALYAADAPFAKNTGAGVMGSGKLLARFLSGALDTALSDDRKSAAKRGEPPTIEGDPFVDSQEAGAKDFTIRLIVAAPAKAEVGVDFDHGDGQRETVTYALVFERGQWRIDDIAYKRQDGSTDTIRKTLRLKP